jgi:hypothetical protein
MRSPAKTTKYVLRFAILAMAGLISQSSLAAQAPVQPSEDALVITGDFGNDARRRG